MTLNARQIKFAQNLAVGMPQLEAYVSAGYKSSEAAACRLAAHPDVVKYCQELQSKQEAQITELTAEQRVNYDKVTALLDEMTAVSIADFMREGSFIPTEEWTPAMRAAGVGFKVRRVKKRGQGDRCDHCGEEVPMEEYIFEIQLPKKDRLVELLGKLKHVGAFVSITHNEGQGEHEDWLAKRAERQNADRR